MNPYSFQYISSPSSGTSVDALASAASPASAHFYNDCCNLVDNSMPATTMSPSLLPQGAMSLTSTNPFTYYPQHQHQLQHQNQLVQQHHEQQKLKGSVYYPSMSLSSIHSARSLSLKSSHNALPSYKSSPVSATSASPSLASSSSNICNSSPSNNSMSASYTQLPPSPMHLLHQQLPHPASNTSTSRLSNLLNSSDSGSPSSSPNEDNPPSSPCLPSTTGSDSHEDYEALRDLWKKAKDISQELTKISKQATKSEYTLVDCVTTFQKEFESIGTLINQMSEKADHLKNDETLKRKKKESDKNAEKRKKRREATMLLNNVCKNCGTTDTPEWRKGPDGTKSLCNACGLHYAKNLKRETMNHSNVLTQPKESMKVVSILN